MRPDSEIMKYLNSLLVAVLSVLSLNGQDFKKVANPEAVYRQLSEASEQVRSIQADFKEERWVSYLKEPQHSSGMFYYLKKDKLRWEQVIPSSYIILINENELKVSEKGTEKNMQSAKRVAMGIRDLMLTMVNGDFQQAKGFTKECLQTTDSYVIVLKPTDKRLRQLYESIQLQFSKNTLTLKQLTFFGKGGDRQIMTFLNEKLNSPVDRTLFVTF